MINEQIQSAFPIEVDLSKNPASLYVGDDALAGAPNEGYALVYYKKGDASESGEGGTDLQIMGVSFPPVSKEEETSDLGSALAQLQAKKSTEVQEGQDDDETAEPANEDDEEMEA